MTRQSTAAAQRGAIVIHVAFALMALLAFTAFVIDYGVMWVARGQAQNAADAGALAGAISLMKDGGADPTGPTGYPYAAAQTYAASGVVWGQANSETNVDVTLSDADTSIPPCGNNVGCVRVDVYRNTPDRSGTTVGTTLPVFFGPLIGITQQGVRATATAETSSGNMIRCLLPFAVIDRWADNHDENPDPEYFANDPILNPGVDGWSPNDEYRPGSGDVYIPPYNGNPGHTGWKVTTDLGRQLVLKDGSPGNYSSGWAMEIDLPDSTGSNDYRWNIENCNTQPVGIASAAETCPDVDEPIGCMSVKTGVSQGPTRQGIGALYDQDTAANWSWASQSVVGGGGMSSPRIRPIVILDINHYIAQGCSGTGCIGKVANIIGFFVEGMCNRPGLTLDPGIICDDPSKDVVGRIVTLPGSFAAGTGSVEESAAFVKVVRLVR
jgi:hypothetical protein